MTVAYIAQIKAADGDHSFVGSGGKIQRVPHFFRSASTLRSYLTSNSYRGSSYTYNTELHKANTHVVMVKDVELGLNKADALVMSYNEFLNAPSPSAAMMGNSRAFYKIKLPSGKIYGASSMAAKKRFGNVYNRASDVRRHITAMCPYGAHSLNSTFKDAQVVEIVLEDDNVNIKAVNIYPVKDFYLASPSSRKYYNRKTNSNPYRAYA